MNHQKILNQFQKLFKLLPDMVIDGHLVLFEKPLKYLPDGLTINGDLNLTGSYIRELPDHLAVNGNLIINKYITEIPKSLMLSGHLKVGTHYIKSNDRFICSERIGSRLSQTIYDTHNGTVSCGCFHGSIYAYHTKVVETYSSDHKYYKEHMEFIDIITNYLK